MARKRRSAAPRKAEPAIDMAAARLRYDIACLSAQALYSMEKTPAWKNACADADAAWRAMQPNARRVADGE